MAALHPIGLHPLAYKQTFKEIYAEDCDMEDDICKYLPPLPGTELDRNQELCVTNCGEYVSGDENECHLYFDVLILNFILSKLTKIGKVERLRLWTVFGSCSP